MEVNEFEKAVIGLILRFPSDRGGLPQRIVAELDSDKFGTIPHKRIYGAIQETVLRKDAPNIPNICRALGTSLESAGGEAYLQSLISYTRVLGVSEPKGFEPWIRAVDSAGRLRHLGLVVDVYAKRYLEFEELVSTVSDVDEFLAQFMQDVNKAAGQVKSDYRHVSEAVAEERRRLQLEKLGYVTDLIPTGWPNLEKYFIPRPSTLGVIAGITSMGKTQFALQILLGAAIEIYENGLEGCVAINELEMAGWRLNRRMTCALSGYDSNDIAAGRLTPPQWEKYEDTLDYISQLPIYYDDSAEVSSQKYGWQAIALHLSKGPRRLGVGDYLELFKDKGDNEELRISNIVRGMRHASWETGACEIAISQFNNSVLMTNSKIGGVSRTRYSGAIGQAADWFVEVYNPPQMRRANISFTLPDGMSEEFAYALVAKNKDHSIGQEPFEWVPAWTRFRDVTLPQGKVYRTDASIGVPDF